MTTISLSISHTPWRPERVESFDRLLGELGQTLSSGPTGFWPDDVSVYTDKAPNHVWSERMWRGAVAAGSEWSLFLQDDARVAPDFRAQLEAMIAALGTQADIIGLEAVHPAIPLLAGNGYRWCTTRDGLVGVGYLVRTRALSEFLEWRATKLKAGWAERLQAQGTGEDTLMGLWSLCTGREIWHPIPTPLDHDVGLPSTYAGNDAHRNRRPLVRWDTFKQVGLAGGTDTTSVGFWDIQHACTVAHLGIFPGWTLPHLALREVDGYDALDDDLADNGRAELAPLLPRSGMCWFCLARPKMATSPTTGAAMCGQCVADVVAARMVGR